MATATRVGWRPSVRMVALTSRASAYTPEDRHTRPRSRRSATCASLGRLLNYTGATNDVIFPR